MVDVVANTLNNRPPAGSTHSKKNMEIFLKKKEKKGKGMARDCSYSLNK
jgi:hypothetical protein